MVACPLSIATVSCEFGTSAKLVDTSVRLVGGEFGTSEELVGTSVRLVGLCIWNGRGARRNECEIGCWLLERVRNSTPESFRSCRFSLLAGLDRREGCLLTRKAWESRQSSQAEKNTSMCGPRRSRTMCLVCFQCAWSFDVCSGIARRGHSSNSCNWRV